MENYLSNQNGFLNTFLKAFQQRTLKVGISNKQFSFYGNSSEIQSPWPTLNGPPLLKILLVKASQAQKISSSLVTNHSCFNFPKKDWPQKTQLILTKSEIFCLTLFLLMSSFLTLEDLAGQQLIVYQPLSRGLMYWKHSEIAGVSKEFALNKTKKKMEF